MTQAACITLQKAVGLFDCVCKLPGFVLGSATGFSVVAQLLPYVAAVPAEPRLTIALTFPKRNFIMKYTLII